MYYKDNDRGELETFVLKFLHEEPLGKWKKEMERLVERYKRRSAPATPRRKSHAVSRHHHQHGHASSQNQVSPPMPMSSKPRRPTDPSQSGSSGFSHHTKSMIAPSSIPQVPNHVYVDDLHSVYSSPLPSPINFTSPQAKHKLPIPISGAGSSSSARGSHTSVEDSGVSGLNDVSRAASTSTLSSQKMDKFSHLDDAINELGQALQEGFFDAEEEDEDHVGEQGPMEYVPEFEEEDPIREYVNPALDDSHMELPVPARSTSATEVDDLPLSDMVRSTTAASADASPTIPPRVPPKTLGDSENAIGRPVPPRRTGTPIKSNRSQPLQPLQPPTSAENVEEDRQEQQLKCKVHHSGDIFVLFVNPTTITYSSLLARVSEKVSPSSETGQENVKLRYEDEDGDYITIYGDDDVRLAIRLVETQTRKRVLNLYVQ